MERFSTKATKKSSDEESKKTPATTATLSGRSSCEELSAQLVALERTKQGLREEAKSAKSLFGLLNDPGSSDEEDEGVVVCDRSTILDTLARIQVDLNCNKQQRKRTKQALVAAQAAKQLCTSQAESKLRMDGSQSPINAGQSFSGDIGVSQLGISPALVSTTGNFC